MLTLEERDAIEADFRWYRYSKVALPFLLVILVLAIVVFCLTAWWQVGSIKGLRGNPVFNGGVEGVPLIIVTAAETQAGEEAGLPKSLRNLRIAEVFIGFFGALWALWTLLAKPRPKARMVCNYLWVLMILAAAVLGWIGFAWGIARIDDVEHCAWDQEFTYERCERRDYKAIVALTADAGVGFFGVLTAVFLAMYTASGDWRINRAGWRERERDAETEVAKQRDPEHLSKQHIRNVRITFLGILLLLFTISIIIVAIFIVYIHEDRPVWPIRALYNNEFTGRDLTQQRGWPARNTRLRYAATVITILTVLVNLIPFTHRLVAYVFAFLYFVAAIIFLIVFGFDVHEMHQSGKIPCPEEFRCRHDPFITVTVLEFILAIVMLVYVLYEYLLKCCGFARSRHSKRHYALHEKRKHDANLDSLRPVRDEITGRVMTAKEYVYRWRFIAGTEQANQYVPLYTEQPLFAAEGYIPAADVVAAAAYDPAMYAAAPVYDAGLYAPAPVGVPLY